MTYFKLSVLEKCSFLLRSPKTLVMPTGIIQASRVDQALCDEAEHGRIHGCGIWDDGCWMLDDGQVRIRLNQGYQLTWGRQHAGGKLDNFSGGNPLIEEWTSNGVRPLNENLSYIQFPYLWASAGAQRWFSRDLFSLTVLEYQQAETLGSRWNLSGNWGESNQLSEYSNWHEDISLQTTWGDSNEASYPVCDAQGNHQYAVEIIEDGLFYYPLPFRYLKRPGFWGPRRVFFPPEKEIAIWYLYFPDKNIENIILTMYPHLMLENNSVIMDDTRIGCLPGGVPSICKTDFTTLRGKKCWIPIWLQFNRAEVEFAVQLAAKLRREYFVFHIVVPNESSMTEITLKDLATLARQHDIFVPEELGCEYLGDLTETVASGSITPVIENVVNEGEAVLIREYDLPPLLLASHIASQAICGKSIFGEHWKTSKVTETLLFIDTCDLHRLSRYKSGYKVRDCRFCDLPPEECLRAFRSFIETVGLVIFAASELLSDHTDTCVEVIRICLTRKIGVLILSENELPRKLKRLAIKTIVASRLPGNNNLNVSLISGNDVVPLEVEFDASGECLGGEVLSERKREFLDSGTVSPSIPPNSSEINAMLNKFQLNN